MCAPRHGHDIVAGPADGGGVQALNEIHRHVAVCRPRIETTLALSRSREGSGAAIVQTLEDVIDARLDLHMGIMVHRNVQAGSI